MNMSTLSLLGFCACALSAAADVCAPERPGLVLHVAPDGDDAADGSAAHPLATVRGAQARLRRLMRTDGAEVVFADGVYRMAAPLELTAQDSGPAGGLVRWRAANRGKAVWSGALTSPAWRPVADPAVLGLLPEAARGRVLVAEFPPEVVFPGFTASGGENPKDIQENPVSLFEDGVRLELARWPNADFDRAKGVGREKGVFISGADRLAAWSREPDLWTFGLWYNEWYEAASRVLGVDAASGTIRIDPRTIGFGMKKGAKHYVFNAYSELDRPGEYVIDRARRRICLWPRGSGEVELAYAPGLVRAAGVANVAFEGLVFRLARENALVFDGCTNCSVVACAVRQTSAGAIIATRAERLRVAGCDLEDLGKGGILLEGGEWATLRRGGNVADNNRIGFYGRVAYNYLPGISLRGVGNEATHNLVHHSPHIGIFFNGNDHRIAWNVLHDTCTYNFDAGAIYCCQRDWTKRGTVVERNLIHMTGPQPRAGKAMAIYLDDYSSGTVVRDNLINRGSYGVYVGGGQDNLVTGNVVMNCNEPLCLASRGTDSPSWGDYARRGRESAAYRLLDKARPVIASAPWRGRYPRLADQLAVEDGQAAHNAYWCVFTNNVLVGCGPTIACNWERIASTCAFGENPSFASDPGFADYFAMDWELAETSGVRRLVGATRCREMGLYPSAERLSPPVRTAPQVTPPRPLHVEYAPSVARVDLVFDGNLPAGVDRMAESCADCRVPGFGRGRRITATFRDLGASQWRDCTFSFVPTVSGEVSFEVSGARGGKTLYDDFVVSGVRLADGDFEGSGWRTKSPDPSDARASLCDNSAPWGVTGPVGSRVACCNEMTLVAQTVRLEKGVPVRVSFRARPYSEEECRGAVTVGGLDIGFAMNLARPGAKQVKVTSDNVGSRTVWRRGVTTVVTWRGHPVCGRDFAAVAELTPQEGGWAWTFRYEGNAAEGLDVESVDFPVIDAPRSDATAVVYPKSMGLQEHPDWPSLGLGAPVVSAKPISFRFIAACDGSTNGVYLDERGARGHAGALFANNGPRPGTVRLGARHGLAITPASNRAFALPYGGTFRKFAGTWYEAARLYRTWTRSQPWARANRAKDRTKLRDIALWLWQRGASEHVIAPAERFQDETGLKPAVDWYWWHKIPYDTEYPFFWPPREGADAFRAAVARMRRRGIFSQVYTNGMSWDCDDPSWTTGGGLEGVRYEKRGGEFLSRMYNVFTKHRLAHLCGEAPKFQAHFVKLATTLAECGLDGLYMDQIGCGSLGSCWNPSHAHAPGGGSVVSDGYRGLFRKVRAANPNLLLSTEEPSEEFLGEVDDVINLWQNAERFVRRGRQSCEPVPVYQALHHGETTLFGSFAILGGRTAWDPTWPDDVRWRDEAAWDRLFSPDQFALEFVRGIVFGNQPCLHNLTLGQIGDPKLADDWRFVKETTAFYFANRDFLYDGEMLSPGRMDCEEVPFDFVVRGTYTTEETLLKVKTISPAVLHSVWRAPDGRKAVVLVNWTRQARRYALEAPDASAAGELPPRSWRKLDIDLGSRVW